MKLLLKDLILINPEQNLNKKNDILIIDGKIAQLGTIETKDLTGVKILELNGSYCSPGFFDMHVHFREPGREDEETIQTGNNSAMAGGFTGVACMPNTNPAIDSAEVLKFIKEKASYSLVDLYPIGAVTKKREGQSLAPIAELIDAGAVAFSDDGVSVKSAQILRKALEYVKMYNSLIIEHCEEGSLSGGVMNEDIFSLQLGLPPIPSVAEDIIVMRDILMTEYVGGKIHFAHISTKNAVNLIRNAKGKGINVTAEATPHHFSLDSSSLKNYDTNFKMNPPLRTKQDVEAIIEGLKDGTIDTIASDHAPHAIEEKELEFVNAPNGIVGLETEAGLIFNELYHKNSFSLEDIIRKISINPRKILNIPVPKIEIGEKANLTIFDPELIWTVDIKKFKSKSKNSPFDKKLLTGKTIATINNSKMFYDDEYFSL